MKQNLALNMSNDLLTLIVAFGVVAFILVFTAVMMVVFGRRKEHEVSKESMNENIPLPTEEKEVAPTEEPTEATPAAEEKEAPESPAEPPESPAKSPEPEKISAEESPVEQVTGEILETKILHREEDDTKVSLVDNIPKLGEPNRGVSVPVPKGPEALEEGEKQQALEGTPAHPALGEAPSEKQ